MISGLKRRYLAAMAAVAAAALAAAGLVLYLHARGTLGSGELAWWLLVDVAAAAGAALVLIAALVDSFTKPLSSVAAALARAAHGDFATAL
ncbi:MAG TPA: hypothetical protein VFJ95_08045, partial [Gammaproteobacteria bacterium]|nr:hypothetical protein [Gammaproteobacteria bacterium]